MISPATFNSNRQGPRSAFTGKREARLGFTLFEVIFTLSLTSVVAVGSLSFLLQSLNTYHYDMGKLLVNRDIRTFTSEMTENAAYANYFMIFPSFSTRTQTVEVGDSSVGFETVTVDASVNDGHSGDFLLLVFTEPEDSNVINRLVGYFRAPSDPDDPLSEGPVRRFETTFSGGASGDIWDLLPEVTSANNQPAVIELSQGLADGKLFYNFRDRSIMVKGKIFHDGNLMRRATNTYNFTVSPRG